MDLKQTTNSLSSLCGERNHPLPCNSLACSMRHLLINRLVETTNGITNGSLKFIRHSPEVNISKLFDCRTTTPFDRINFYSQLASSQLTIRPRVVSDSAARESPLENLALSGPPPAGRPTKPLVEFGETRPMSISGGTISGTPESLPRVPLFDRDTIPPLSSPRSSLEP